MLTSTITRSKRLRQHLLHRFDAVDGLLDLEAGPLQRVAVIQADQRGVVDDQDARRVDAVAVSDSVMIHLRLLIDDRVRKAADVEQR